jgi:ribosome maturation factor RimP
LDLVDTIEALIAPVADELGYELVRVQMQGGARRATLQIMAERRDRAAMIVDDCARLSRAVSALLDETDPIQGEYLLEVSSPGIDRPLMKRADYDRFIGHEAKVEVDPPVDGRKRFHGTILATGEDALSLDCEGASVSVPFRAIRKAKLVLTDRLIAAVQEENAAAAAKSGEAAEPAHHA